MDHAYRPHTNVISIAAIAALALAGAVLTVLVNTLVRQRFGVSPAILLRMALASAAHLDPRLAACPIIIMGDE
jgi:uncharacterized membrane protein YoaK (UPF0700 family)